MNKEVAKLKAWERELKTMRSSVPVVLEEDEQGWMFCEQVEKLEDRQTQMKWESYVPGSGAMERVIVAAIQDTENMGYDVSEAEALIDEGIEYLRQNNMSALTKLTARIYHILENAPKIEGHSYHKYTVYDSFEKILDAVNFKDYPSYPLNDEYAERTYYGWLYQICAGALGTAVEGYTTENIRKAFGEVHDYVRTPNTYNDDITYEVAFLRALAEKGKGITSAAIGEEWVALVPFGWSAEEFAIKNIKLGIYPPFSGKCNNPYREWIGAQMRGAVCGMVAPANPREAARFAFMDGVVSHFNNGVLGEVFNACLVSLAYVHADMREIVFESASYIPNDSEYYSVLEFAINSCKHNTTWETAWKKCEEKYKRYNWIHSYPNAAAEVVALWFGENDFDKTMHISAMQGYDVDCNAAQIASALGVANCGRDLAKKWSQPIGDKLKTYMRDNKEISIRELAKETVRVTKSIV